LDAPLAARRESLYRRHRTAGGNRPMSAVRVSLVAALLFSLGLTAMAAAGFH
jgi:hypothetical protein